MRMGLRVLVVFVAMLGASAGIFAGTAESPRRIEIQASKYSYSPSEITLKKGETVVLVLNSADVTHGLKVTELGIKADIKKGHPTEITVTPTETGHFKGKCSHFCGQGHGSMTLDINVVE